MSDVEVSGGNSLVTYGCDSCGQPLSELDCEYGAQHCQECLRYDDAVNGETSVSEDEDSADGASDESEPAAVSSRTSGGADVRLRAGRSAPARPDQPGVRGGLSGAVGGQSRSSVGVPPGLVSGRGAGRGVSPERGPRGAVRVVDLTQSDDDEEVE